MPIELPDQSFFDQHDWMWRWITNLKFTGNVRLNNTPNGLSVYIPPQKQTPATRPRDGLIVAKIDSARTGGGLYKGFRVARPTSPISAIADLDTEDLGEIGTDEITLVNLQEMNSATHWLSDAANTNQLYCFALPWGTDDNDVAAYAICHIWVSTCTPSDSGDLDGGTP